MAESIFSATKTQRPIAFESLNYPKGQDTIDPVKYGHFHKNIVERELVGINGAQKICMRYRIVCTKRNKSGTIQVNNLNTI